MGPRTSRMARGALVLAVLALAGPADAAVPRGFIGVTYDRAVAESPSTALQTAQWRSMARNGAQSVRVVFRWNQAQPEANGPVSYRDTDAIVERAARNNLVLLPCVMYAPVWARRNPFSGASPPKQVADYANYVAGLAARYGSSGTFWTGRPDIPRRPIRDWQIWNEPSLKFQWDAPDWERGYGQLLRAANAALKSADPFSRTVLAGLPNKSWESLASLYRKGNAKFAFDIATVHAYTGASRYVLLLVQYARREMRRFKDGAKPLWVTEIGLPAAKGRTRSKNTLQTTDKGMARFLSEIYDVLATKGRRTANVQRVYWYTWASRYRGAEIYNYSGLHRFAGGRAFPRPALTTFRAMARKLTR